MRGQLHRLTNTSGIDLVEVTIQVRPPEESGQVGLKTLAGDGRYEPGDVIEFIPLRAMSPGAKKLVIIYRRSDEPKHREFIVPL